MRCRPPTVICGITQVTGRRRSARDRMMAERGLPADVSDQGHVVAAVALRHGRSRRNEGSNEHPYCKDEACVTAKHSKDQKHAMEEA
ncbi:hypothetical protein GW17_00049475 [Ensete ventricosum]|nr:hypothetical protein GW17_00049475 [Ensete ventricosum]RZR98423.1 hypothetical protein BHM03_00027777 [Ensete ventricosum]